MGFGLVERSLELYPARPARRLAYIYVPLPVFIVFRPNRRDMNPYRLKLARVSRRAHSPPSKSEIKGGEGSRELGVDIARSVARTTQSIRNR